MNDFIMRKLYFSNIKITKSTVFSCNQDTVRFSVIGIHMLPVSIIIIEG